MTATHIGDTNVWIGDIEDAIEWKGNMICVLENLPEVEPQHALWIPILRVKWEKRDESNPEWGYAGYIEKAIPQQLDLVAQKINELLKKDKSPILVNCGAGQERSPLAVTWWLWKHLMKDSTFHECYDYVKSFRKQTIQHPEWLNINNY